jgi:hypothetical protein
MTSDLFSLVLAPLQTTYVDLLLLHHGERVAAGLSYACAVGTKYVGDSTRRAIARRRALTSSLCTCAIATPPCSGPLRDGQEPAPAVLERLRSGPRRARHLRRLSAAVDPGLRGHARRGLHPGVGRLQLGHPRPAAGERAVRGPRSCPATWRVYRCYTNVATPNSPAWYMYCTPCRRTRCTASTLPSTKSSSIPITMRGRSVRPCGAGLLAHWPSLAGPDDRTLP